jgi:hypothetical protein
VDGATREAFARPPRAYVTGQQDRAIAPAMQRRMFAAAGCDPVIELDTDRSPWLSRTDELVAALNPSIANSNAPFTGHAVTLCVWTFQLVKSV